MTGRLIAFVRGAAKEPRRARITAAWIAIFILSMVPLGRPVQALGNRAADWLGMDAGYFVVLVAAVLALPYLAFYAAIARIHSRVFALLHFIAGLAAGAVFYSTVHLPIEAAHVLMFASFTAAYRLSLPDGREKSGELRSDCLAFAAAVLLAVLDEALQGLHPRRVFDLRDILLDSEAALIGLLFVKPLLRIVRIDEIGPEKRP